MSAYVDVDVWYYGLLLYVLYWLLVALTLQWRRRR